MAVRRSLRVVMISLCLTGLTAGVTEAGCVPIWARLQGLFATLLPHGSGNDDEPCQFGTAVTKEVEPAAQDIVIPIKKKAWERAHGGEEAARPYVRARLSGWPDHLLVDRNTLPSSDDAFLARLARDVWTGLDALTDRENGLPVDNVRFDAPNGRVDGRVGDYTNVTSIGLRLIAIVAAADLRLISPHDAIAKLRRVLATLNGLETYDGFFFNYYDTTSLERTSNFVSFVDSSWLTAGLMVVRMAFPELAVQCTQLIERTDYRFFYDDALQQMSHGYYVNRAARSHYHYGVLYAESRLGSLIAIGKGEAPEALWFHMLRTFPAACTWQTEIPTARKRKEVDGYELAGGYYEWRGLRYVPSWGGSMFEALMPTLVLDEPRYAAHNLGANDVVHAIVQRRYALEELGYPVWGMSPSSTPDGAGYSEYGVRPLGAAGYKAGAVTPHAAALALSVTPDVAIANLRRLAALYDIYGPYGFYDAVDPHSGMVAHKYLALDQAMTFIALANYLDDHVIQKRFAADPIAQKALPLIHDEDFFN